MAHGKLVTTRVISDIVYALGHQSQVTISKIENSTICDDSSDFTV